MGRIIAFIVWVICGLVFVAIGIYDMSSKKEVPFGFWANAKAPEVKDVKAYNKEVGKLFIFFGVLFIPLGLPLLAGDNNPYIIISIVGAMFLTIAIMVIYTIKIEAVYRK